MKNIFCKKKPQFIKFWGFSYCFINGKSMEIIIHFHEITEISRVFFTKYIFSSSKKKFSEKIIFFHKLDSSGYCHTKYELLTPNTRKVVADTVSRTEKKTIFIGYLTIKKKRFYVFDFRPIPFRDISIFLFKNWFWVKYKYSTMHFYGRNRLKWSHLVGLPRYSS